MTTAAKGGFPGCPRRKIEKRKIRNFNHRNQKQKWENNLAILDQIKKNVCRFYKTFGNSDEDDEFHGFSSEECGLIAYKRIGGSNQGSSRVPDILGSPIDLNKKKVTTRLAHAKKSQNAAVSKQVKRRKKTATRLKYSKDEVQTHTRNKVQTESLGSRSSQDSDGTDQCFTKYTSSNLDFHRLSESTSFGSRPTTLKQPVRKSHKTSPIKPATFIAPSMSNNNSHQVTNVTPTCLKIKLNPLDETGPGHPKVIAKALLARANRRGRKPIVRELDEPMHTSTPINATSKSKTKSFILPAKSSRSSRIIKANRKYVDDDSPNNEEQQIASFPPAIQSSTNEQSKACHFQSYDTPSPNKGRPLLKEPTFRVAALANINNKPQPSRNDKVISTRMRARKLIKRARFKHPTSSSTLVVGNDFDDETNRKKNLIREATFKMPDQKQNRTSTSKLEKNQLSDLGLSKEEWGKVLQNEIKYETKSPLWTVQEIHNVLQGANTFSNSWTSVARHFDYHPCHRDWCSVRTKSRTLINIGLLSENLKVKSSILLQLKPQYSDNPNVTVFTAKELRIRGMECNLECDVGEGGRMIKVIKNQDGELKKGTLQRQRKRSQQSHRNYFSQWRKCISEDYDDPNFMYFGLDKANFQKMCVARIKGKPSWSVREIHNVLHGIHIFGVGEWNTIHEMYAFNPRHNNLGIRGRFKSVCCRGLVIAGEVREDVLKVLRPKFSAMGKKYFGIKNNISSPVDSTKAKKQADDALINDEALDGKKQRNRKRTASSETVSDGDMTSPPRKQAYHLFGAAPVWDDSGSGLQSLKSNSEIEEEAACEQVFSSPTVDNKDENSENETNKKTTKGAISSTRPKKQTTNTEDTKKKNSGPRIKHVCRRASLVTGQKQATYGDDSVNPQLSALPKDERRKIAAEAERLRDVKTDVSISSDSDSESACSPVKPIIRRKEKTKPSQVHQIRKRSDRNNTKAKRCNCCINCKISNCGECENCRSSSLARECIRKLPCLNPIDTNVPHPSDTLEKTRQQPKRNSAFGSSDCAQRDIQRTTSSGVILSPDSRHKLQQELHERDQHLPSVVKVDEWKERYELEDLWKMGGVSIITSTTPSTRLLCFLCGSVGRTRPARRVSSTSDSSMSSTRSNCTTQTPLFIFCYSCCEPFHSFCLDDHEQQPAIAAAKKGIWICKRCRFCNVCGRPGNLLECKRCNKTYHSACLGPSYPTKPSKNQVWVCMRCVRCRSCGVSRPGRRPGSKWTHDFQLCQRCGDLFDKGNFCPICRRCYRDEDYESRMVQCGTCKRWVHSRCESLTTEMYTLLSHLPDDVQYICPDCDGRRNKVELELSHSDTILTDDSANDSLEGDKMRGLLCKLPSPSWKKRIESEVQSGIENVMMALFHNKEAACILKTSVVQQEDGRPVDLFAVRFAVHNRQYKSVCDFSSDVCCILDTLPDDVSQTDIAKDEKSSRKWKRKRNTIGARGAFFKEMHDVFPWFDIETGRVRDASDVPEDLLPHATLPPHMDHNYAQWQDRDIDIMSGGPDTPIKNPFANDSPSKPDDIGTIVWATTPQKQFDDMRQCLFCAQYGDAHATNAGRLVYCGQDEWVHVNCALWSAEVFERHDGSLQNVYSAVSRGKMMKCELCKLPGATVGCNTKDCPQNYHFACAKQDSCVFQDDKKVFCSRHVKHVDNEIVTEEGFEVARRVVVDKDEMRPNKRWQRGMFSQNITILMGSAIVHQLGQLSPSSDHKDYLIPVQFRMTRMFWSTVHAGRRVRYTITVTEQKSVMDGPARIAGLGSPSTGKTESHGNRTISHADDDKLSTNTTSLQSKRIPSVDSCRSKLVDRFHANPEHGPLHRRRSQDQSTVDPGILRSRRFSGSSYTVIGSVNRTLPQAITPLPTRSSTTFQRLLPTVQESKNNEFYRSTPEIDKNISAKTQFPSDFQASDIKDAVKVSHQNPYLNVGLDMGDDSKKNSSLATTEGLAFCTAKDTNMISRRKMNEGSKDPTLISSTSDVSSIALNSNIVHEITTVNDLPLPISTSSAVVALSDYSQSTSKQFASLRASVANNSNLKLGSSGSILNCNQPSPSSPDDFRKVVLPAPSSDFSVLNANSEPGNRCTDSEANKSPERNNSLVDQMLTSTASSILTVQKSLAKLSESVQTPCEVQNQALSKKTIKLLNEDVNVYSDVSKYSEPSDVKPSQQEENQQMNFKPGLCTVKESMERESKTPKSNCLSDSKVDALSSKETSAIKNSFEESDHSHTLGLFKGARIAQEEEAIENVINQKNVELERLWWQKGKSSEKTTKANKKRNVKYNTSVDGAWVLPESEKNSMTSFQEDKVSRVQTRSRGGTKESPNTEVIQSDASENEIPNEGLKVAALMDEESSTGVTNTMMVAVLQDDTKDKSNEKMDTNEENASVEATCADNTKAVEDFQGSQTNLKKDDKEIDEKDYSIKLKEKSMKPRSNENIVNESSRDIVEESDLNSCKISTSSKNCIGDVKNCDLKLKPPPEADVGDNIQNKKSDESTVSTPSSETSSFVSSVSEGSYIEASKDVVKIRSLRKFAKNTGESDAECITEAVIVPLKAHKRRGRNIEIAIPRRTTRSFSHESRPIMAKNEKVICNGSSDPCDANLEDLSRKDTRVRSKSVDAGKKKKQKSDALKKVRSHLEISDADFSAHRYPRRNPYTCLKSFSGLSPNYAIQSYSPNNQGRHNRAAARLLEYPRKSVKKLKNNATNKRKVQHSRSKSKTENLSSSSVIKEEALVKFSESCDTVNVPEEQNKEMDLNQSHLNSKSKMEPALTGKKDEDSVEFPDSFHSTESCERKSGEEKNEEVIKSTAVEETTVIDSGNSEKGRSSGDASPQCVSTKQSSMNDSKNKLEGDIALKKVNNQDENILSPNSNNQVKDVLASSDDTVEKHCISEMEKNFSNEKSLEQTSLITPETPQTDEPCSRKTSITLENETTKALPGTQSADSIKPATLTDAIKLVNCKSDSMTNAIETDKDISSNFSTDVQPAEVSLIYRDTSKNVIADDRPGKIQCSHSQAMSNSAVNSGKTTKESFHNHELPSVQVKEDTADRSLASQPAVEDSYNDSIEIVRGIIDEDEKQKEAIPTVFPEHDIKMSEHNRSTHHATKLPDSPLIPNSLPNNNDLGSFAQCKQKAYCSTVDELESPLSPRDEPRLPLPMETDATASFLVTSDCPVLNADEVQSLLAMPTTTTTCSEVFTMPVAPVLATIPNQQPHQSSYRKPYISVVNTVPEHQTYLTQSKDVALFPVTYTPCSQQVPLVVPVYNQPCTNQPVNITIANSSSGELSAPYGVQAGGLSQPILISPSYNKASPAVGFTYGMSFGNQLMPVVVPNNSQPLTYIATPMQQSNQALVMQPNHITPPQYNRFHNAQPPSRNILKQGIVRRGSNSQCRSQPVSNCKNSYLLPRTMESTNLMTESSVTQIVKPVTTSKSSSDPQSLSFSLPNKHNSAQGLNRDVELTSDQQDKLDQMIEYYSNKNKLSDEEKLIVRTIIAQQIQNKSLPMPSPDTAAQSSSANVDENLKQSKPGMDKPAILHGQKRKQLLTEPCETPQKRIKKSKRKERLISRECDSATKASKTIEEPLYDKSVDFESSPLLNVYLNAIRAEHTTDDKLVKKWRDVVWNLSRHNVHMDVPWLYKRGHRDKENRLPPPPQSSKRSHLLYQIKSEDGYCVEGTDLQELIANLLDSVQECRGNACIPSPSLCLSSILSPYAFLGVSHDTVRFLVEQLPGARHCLRYRAKYHKHREPPTEVITHINPHGCARAEKYQGRSKPDMFSFLASKHRLPPSYDPSLTQNVDMQQNSTRRPTSMDLPMAMRFRHLRTSAHEAVGVYRSAIHGRGLYCKRDIEAGEMVMEYTGEVIRCFLTDHREKMYEKKGIGCYMFRMDDMYVVDATMMGSGARFINHSCEPSCYSRIVTIDGKKHIIIFALRKILRGEELTYDYKFPIEADDQKIMCNCGARTCRKYMN